MQIVRTIRKGLRFIGRGPLLAASTVAGVVAITMATGGDAFATCSGSFCGNGGDTVDVGFGTLATTILGYLGDAVALVLLVIGLGLGIRMLIKWTKRAVSAT